MIRRDEYVLLFEGQDISFSRISKILPGFFSFLLPKNRFLFSSACVLCARRPLSTPRLSLESQYFRNLHVNNILMGTFYACNCRCHIFLQHIFILNSVSGFLNYDIFLKTCNPLCKFLI